MSSNSDSSRAHARAGQDAHLPSAAWRPLRPSPPAPRPRSAAAGSWEARRTLTKGVAVVNVEVHMAHRLAREPTLLLAQLAAANQNIRGF